MTRRERLENKIDRRLEWARTRESRANHTLNNRPSYASDWAFITQPGHIPSRARLIAQESKAFESLAVAEHHRSAAAGLQDQLDRSIYSDDQNAIEALEARIAEHEAKRARMVQVNKLYRKGDAEGLAALGINLETLKTELAAKGPYWGDAPHLPYEMQNLGGRIRADKQRLEQIKARSERAAAAQDSPNGITLEQREYGYVRVTFAEKPDRSILDALKAAGFFWGSGSWAGKAEALPACVREMLESKEEVSTDGN